MAFPSLGAVTLPGCCCVAMLGLACGAPSVGMMLVAAACGEEEWDEGLAGGRALDEQKHKCLLSPAASVTFSALR